MESKQPLSTLTKKLQTEHSEGYYQVICVAMHTEKMLCGMYCDRLDINGWNTALTNSGISTSGKAQSFTSVHHICRTRYMHMHQVSVATLYMLMRKAFDHYIDKTTNEPQHEISYNVVCATSKAYAQSDQSLC